MGEVEKTLRLEKEREILNGKAAPAIKSKIGHILDRMILKTLLPTLHIVGKGKINKHLRSATTAFKVQDTEVNVKDIDKHLIGLKIAHLSDLHLDLKESFPSALERFFKAVKPTLDKCDLIVITGDFQDKYKAPIDKTIQSFKSLLPHIQAPIIGVLGNHDRLELADALEQLPSNNGLRILVNETIKIQRQNGGKFLLQGIDDPHYYKTHNIKDHTIKGHDQKIMGILLAHGPESYIEAQKKGISLHLNGHTHGGQMRLPGIGALAKASKVPNNLLQGLWKYKTLLGHTSPGLGCSGLSIRLLCPPEINILTLN